MTSWRRHVPGVAVETANQFYISKGVAKFKDTFRATGSFSMEARFRPRNNDKVFPNNDLILSLLLDIFS